MAGDDEQIVGRRPPHLLESSFVQFFHILGRATNIHDGESTDPSCLARYGAECFSQGPYSGRLITWLHSAQLAAQFCHPPARRWYRPGADSESARPSLDRNYQPLHPRQPDPPATGYQSVGSPAHQRYRGGNQVMIPSPNRPLLEVADILRAHGQAYGSRYPVAPLQAAGLRRLVACRTAVLGGHVDACQHCSYTRVSYNSCRDRHCPKCQGVKRAQWLQARLERLLPVEHFHVVFTLPAALYPLMLYHPRQLYDLLFQAASQTLLTLAADSKRLGAQIGLTAILHTWGQNLLFHPHLHCVVTGGGLSPDGSRWVAARPGYLLPVKVLGRLFRGKFLAGIQQAYQAGQLTLAGSVASLAQPQAFRRWLDTLYRQNWVVYAKRPFGGAQQVFRYLGRYSHRVAIANSRLLALENGQVSFHWKDYDDDHRTKVMRLTAGEFIRRFLLHVLPKRFVRIRHYGLLAGRHVSTRLARCRQLLGEPKVEPRVERTWLDRLREWTGQDLTRCPQCGLPSPKSHVSLPTSARKVRTLKVTGSPTRMLKVRP